MNSFVLGPDTSQLTVGQFIAQAAPGGLEVRNERGEILAFVLSPADVELLTYADAERDFALHRPLIEEALSRNGGSSTAEMLRKAVDQLQR
jgi:hypothetical protein